MIIKHQRQQTNMEKYLSRINFSTSIKSNYKTTESLLSITYYIFREEEKTGQIAQQRQQVLTPLPFSLYHMYVPHKLLYVTCIGTWQ